MTTIAIDRAVVEQALDILDSEFTSVDGEFCRWCDGRLTPARHSCKLEQTITALRAALAEPTVPSDCADSHQPVAWYFEARHIDSAWAAAVTLKHPGPEGKYMRKVTPLYTAPPQRKPLTEEEIDCIWATEKVFRDIYEITRAIERAHGIGDDK